MYTLTLTKAERDAIDWVGDRYATGHQLYLALAHDSTIVYQYAGHDPTMEDWEGEFDITFSIPESIAWHIRDLTEQEDSLYPCFSSDLAQKLQQFVDSIV